jgi:hypothetical protein
MLLMGDKGGEAITSATLAAGAFLGVDSLCFLAVGLGKAA